MPVSRKDRAVNSTGKREQELQRPGSTAAGPQGVRNISPQQDRKGSFKQTKISHVNHKKKEEEKKLKTKSSNSTIPPSPDNLNNDPPPTLWDLLQVYLLTVRPFITSHCSITYAAGTVRLYNDKVN